MKAYHVHNHHHYYCRCLWRGVVQSAIGFMQTTNKKEPDDHPSFVIFSVIIIHVIVIMMKIGVVDNHAAGLLRPSRIVCGRASGQTGCSG